MNGEVTGEALRLNLETDWEKLRQMTDKEIHAAVESDPDINPTDANFWMNAKIVLPQRKEVVTIRLDADLVEWFRQEKGYQTKINAILRAYMLARTPHSQSGGKGSLVAI
jgi:uncharacterized protein (DUF4415 family)